MEIPPQTAIFRILSSTASVSLILSRKNRFATKYGSFLSNVTRVRRVYAGSPPVFISMRAPFRAAAGLGQICDPGRGRRFHASIVLLRAMPV